MARAPRIQIADGIYHISCRGVRKSAVYRGIDDRKDFLSMLGVTVARREWSCLQYCELTNHYHLLVQTPNPDLALGMQMLNGFYAQNFNRRHGLAGHAFERRYDARLIESYEQLVATVRYIAWNPVEAGICATPTGWDWSSIPASIGLAPAPEFLDTSTLLMLLGLESAVELAALVGVATGAAA
jgi:REP-associated tyrosine transposase